MIHFSLWQLQFQNLWPSLSSSQNQSILTITAKQTINHLIISLQTRAPFSSKSTIQQNPNQIHPYTTSHQQTHHYHQLPKLDSPSHGQHHHLALLADVDPVLCPDFDSAPPSSIPRRCCKKQSKEEHGQNWRQEKKN
ncbi:hypothetical protein M0R45_026526 [Rubus argutus]|uniref:Uncharacterized protein n=1 Tax=Rubus argutus TaxID=59490 RepID=A0AAW1WZH6_RUBAR